MIAVTGATGKLGRLAINGLLTRMPADQIVAVVRTFGKARDLAALGVQVREADYSRPEGLASALAGATKVLLISGNEIGRREAQHQAVVDAVKKVEVAAIIYTSLLHADTSPLDLAAEHVGTEQYLRTSGVPFCLLRNGWYIENQTAAISLALQKGVFVGASGEGRISGAARADYAAAAVTVLTEPGHENQTYELAGDDPYTLSELVADVNRQTGSNIRFENLKQSDYESILSRFLPAELSHLIADAETKAALGALEDHSHTLRRLIGRSTTSLAASVAAELKVIFSSEIETYR